MGKKDKILESFKVNGTKYTYKDKYTTEEIQELRAKRTELQKQIDDIQKQIDTAVMEMYEVPDFEGKCIFISDDVIMCVKRVERLNYGIRVIGSEMYYNDSENYGIMCAYPEHINWEDIKHLKIATANDVLALKNKIITQFNKKYEEEF